MKKNLLPFAMILSLFAVVSFMGCDKAKDAVTSLSAGKCEVKATISGAVSASYSSDLMGSTAIKNGLLMNLGSATVSLPIKQFVLIIPANVTTGTYQMKSLNGSAGWAMSYVHNNGADGWATGAGADEDFTVVVTKATATEVEGTFSGKMVNDEKKTSINVTNGSFKAKF